MRGLGQRLELNARLDGLLRPALGGNTPSWALGTYWRDFVKDVGILPNPTDTHGQTIYEPDSSGLYLPYAANVLTRTDLGLQTVPTRTNICLQSQTFDNVFWSKMAASVTANATTAPDGTATADNIVPDTSSAIHRLLAGTITVTAASTYTVSVFAKTAGYRYLFLNGTGNFGARATFDLQSGVITQTGAGSATITAAGNGWYLCTITGVATGTGGDFYAQVNSSVTTATDDTFTGNGTSGIYLWNAQLELGSFATPPIPTTTASATVNGNQQVIDLTGRLGTGVAGLIQINQNALASGNTRVFDFNDGTTANRFGIFVSSANFVLTIDAATVWQGDTTIAARTTGLVTLAFAMGTNFATGRLVGGSAVTADTTVTLPTLTKLSIGGRFDAVENNYQFAKKLALSFGPQDQTSFDAMYARAVLAAAA